jgi:hypothetical protein
LVKVNPDNTRGFYMANTNIGRRYKVMRQGISGGIRARLGAPAPEKKFAVNDVVVLSTTKQKAKIIEITSYGFYVLEGISGEYPASALESPADPP